MSEDTRKNLSRVNFFDGQRVTEIDLDDEQFYFLNKINNIAVDFHSSGVLDADKLNRRILFDSSSPGKYGENPSSSVISAGFYDGRAITTDIQPSDSIHGNKLEIELTESEARGRDIVRVLIIGRTYNSLEASGDLVAELIEFRKNEVKLTSNYFTKINGVIFNNFSGGEGLNEYGSITYKPLGIDGKITIKEASPLKVFYNSLNIESVQSPNMELKTFGSSSSSRSLIEEINLSLTSEDVIGDLFIDFDHKEILKFEENGSISKAFGQKFLNKSNNIQSVDLFMGLESGENWTGELVFSIYELASDVNCKTDEDFDRLIDFDPDIVPIAEVSYDQETLADLGFKIGLEPKMISFDFSGSFIANPNMSPEIKRDKFYAFMVSRRGDNSSGTILMYKGYDKSIRKEELLKPLNPIDKYGRQETRFVEFDPAVRRYIDDYTSSLWFRVNSSSAEVTDGIFYSDTGAAIVLPKIEEYVGNSYLPKSYNHIDLKDLSSGGKNYVVIDEKKSFVDADVHPRTGNFIFTRIQDSAEINIYNQQEYSSLTNLNTVVLGRVIDSNARSLDSYDGVFNLPGLINEDYFYIINPESGLITQDLIGRNFIPDTECQCANVYKIVDVQCISSYLGDLDSSKKIEASDLIEAIGLSGLSLGSEAAENKILGGEVDILKFYKSDVNDDGTVDGADIELLEQALEGAYNFSKPRKFNVLKIYVQSLFEEPEKIIFEDSSNTSNAISSSNIIEITLDDYRKGLAVRIGDIVSISEGSTDDGLYRIASKGFDTSTLLLTLTVELEDGSEVSFDGVTLGNFAVISRNDTNMFVDNLGLIDVPYSEKKFSMYQSSSSFMEEKLNVCDLRRYVEFSFVEVEDLSCICIEDDCEIIDECDPRTKNQKYLPDDLIISGDILGEDRLPYHGDYEYANIIIPLPPGDVIDCKIDIYNTFVKADGANCLTSYGYPAMKYSDGTYVGCEDTSISNDISKNRIKFLDAIGSLYVASQNQETGSITLNETFNQFISNFSKEYIYEGFSSWVEDSLNSSSNITISNGSSSSDFTLDTLETTGLRFARLNAPSEVGGIEGDFIVDVRMSRKVWDENSITFGTIRAGNYMVIENESGHSEVKIGFIKNGANNTKYFFESKLFDESSTLIDEYYFEKDIEESLLQDVVFRLRRINDVISGYYISPENINFIDNPDEQFVKINGRMARHAGYGIGTTSLFIEQEKAPTAANTFTVTFKDCEIKHTLSSEERLNEIVPLSREQSSSEAGGFLVTFPLNIGSSTILNSSTLTFVARSSISTSMNIKIKKVNALNLDNLDPYYNYLIEEVLDLNIGPVSDGDLVSINVISMISDYLSRVGHLPGFIKGFYIEVSDLENNIININPNDFKLNLAYSENITGETFKVGLDLDRNTGILSISTKNILYDFSDAKNRTLIRVGVLLKKKGFINKDLELSLLEVKSLGIGDCGSENVVLPILESEVGCVAYFISGLTMPGTPVGGAFNANLHIGLEQCVEALDSSGIPQFRDPSVTSGEQPTVEEPTPVVEPEEPSVIVEEFPNWSPELIKSNLLSWFDQESFDNTGRSAIPQRVAIGDPTIYDYSSLIKNKKADGPNFIVDPEQDRLRVSPVILKDSIVKRSFLRFDGVRNFMILEGSEANSFGLEDKGISVFMVSKLGAPTSDIGSPDSTDRYDQESLILSKGIYDDGSDNKEVRGFAYSLVSKFSTDIRKINSFAWNNGSGEIVSKADAIDTERIGIYSFSTSSKISSEFSKENGFRKNTVRYDSDAENSYREDVIFRNPEDSSPIFLGGLKQGNTSKHGVSTGLNLTADIYEMIIIVGEVGELTRKTIEGYLAHKYELQSYLSAGHPFKEEAPKENTGSQVIVS